MNFIANRLFKLPSLFNKNIYNYGEITFNQDIKVQTHFDHVTAYRAFDLEGQLLDKTIKYDLDYLNKILRAMIYVDEMDSILLKVKGQGKSILYQFRKNIILHDFLR